MKTDTTIINKDEIHFFIRTMLFLFSIYIAFVCYQKQYHLSYSDTFYYLSVAQNVIEKGQLLDGTTEPNGPIVTPQNGIVFLLVLLRKMNLSQSQCLIWIPIIQFSCLLFTSYPMIKIVRNLGLGHKWVTTCILSVYLGNIVLHQWMYLAILNDTIHFILSIWLIYVIFRYYDLQDAASRRAAKLMLLILIGIISLLIVHFRINAFFIPLSIIIAAIATKRYKYVPVTLFTLAVMGISFFAVYGFIHTLDLSPQTNSLPKIQKDLINYVYKFLFKVLPTAIFCDLNDPGNLLYMPFCLAMIIGLIRGIQKKETLFVAIILICTMTFLMTFLHGCLAARYIWQVAIFLYAVLFRVVQFRPIGYLFIFAIFTNTVWSLYNGVGQSAEVAFWEYVEKNAVIDECDPVVITNRNRMCWYFTGIKSCYKEQYTWEQLVHGQKIYIIGDDVYMQKNIDKINTDASKHNYKIENKILTEDCKHYRGDSIHQITLVPLSCTVPE